MRRLALAWLLLFPPGGVYQATARKPEAATHQVSLNGHTFTLPTGFEIELVAGPPLVNRPITADFDEQGRLFVTDSSGSNDNVKLQLEKKPHRIVRLENTKGDGKFDRATVFADRMMFPEGTMWFDGSLYVSAPPSIWKLTDTKGTGTADQRVEWFQGKTLTGCANDLHGPYLGPDGWIYWCKGAFAQQTYERPGKKPLVTRAAHIFRARPDGSGIEPVMTGGMDNPVDVVFTPGGERIFTTTFFQHPGGGQRDGLVHATYGGIYGKDHEPIYRHPWTSPDLMPVLTHMGPAAPCGLTRYESNAFGPEYQDNLFACQFNMHKVSRHVLKPNGATFKTEDHDFLVSDNLDFHPTDIIEDADGSLLVIDTGGWYKLCCPTSQLHKPDILGAIYRIRRSGATRSDDPRGLKIDWQGSAENLAKLLGDPRPAVRRRAIQTLARQGEQALPALQTVLGNSAKLEARRNAVWTATRIAGPAARAIARQALKDQDETVRQVALHSISLWRDREAVPALIEVLHGQSFPNRRAAAEALGRIGDKSSVPELLLALGMSVDRVLEHSLTFALIEIDDAEQTAKGLQSDNPRIVRTALTALDQMENGRLKAETVTPFLTASDPALKRTAAWIIGRHLEWGETLAGYLRERIHAKNETAAEEEELTSLLARFAATRAVQELLAEALMNDRNSLTTRRIAIRAMGRAGLKTAPDRWLEAIHAVLFGGNRELVAEAVAAARNLHPAKGQAGTLAAGLLRIAENIREDEGLRLRALAAAPDGLNRVDPGLFTFLLAHLSSERPVADRGAAADILSHARLNSEQLLDLARALKSVGPMELDRLLEPFVHSTDAGVGHALLESLKSADARASLRVDAVQQRLAKYPIEIRKEAEQLYALLDVDREKQRAHLDKLLGSIKSGDVRRGQTVFHSTKAACFSCHAVGYRGGTIGPDLTRIGAIRSERDLLESIVYPSASFVRGYEPVLVATKDGRTHNGLIKKDAPDEVLLVIAADKEERIPRADIEAIEPSKVSVMPAGLEQQLTVQDLADLVAFLKACK